MWAGPQQQAFCSSGPQGLVAAFSISTVKAIVAHSLAQNGDSYLQPAAIFDALDGATTTIFSCTPPLPQCHRDASLASSDLSPPMNEESPNSRFSGGRQAVSSEESSPVSVARSAAAPHCDPPMTCRRFRRTGTCKYGGARWYDHGPRVDVGADVGLPVIEGIRVEEPLQETARFENHAVDEGIAYKNANGGARSPQLRTG